MINRYLNRFLAAICLLSVVAPGFAGLPPTTSKDAGDTTDKATFIYRFPYFSPGTHTGTVLSLGPLYGASGITGVIPNSNTTATSTNTNSAIVTRDGSGDFSFGTGTGSITGHSSLDLSIANNLSDVNSASTSFDNISGMTLLGDIIYGGASGTRSKLAGSTSASLAVLTQTGNGSVSAAPIWSTTACLTNPMSASGDIIYGGASGVPTKLVKATNTNALVLSAGIPAWASMPKVQVSTPGWAPTFTGFGTVTSYTAWYGQTGDCINGMVTFTVGTTTATEARISLPNSYTSSTSYPTISVLTGNVVTNSNGVAGFYPLIEPNKTYMTFGLQDGTHNGLTKTNGSIIAAAGSLVSVSFYCLRVDSLFNNGN